MATNGSRSAAAAARLAVQQCRPSHHTTRTTAALQCAARSFSTTRSTARPEQAQSSQGERPRWSYTPEAMKAPFSPHITKNPARKVWEVNSDPKKLDQMYARFLGRDGDKLLPEEVKWLAVTHKSFDYGRRGFNDRLAFLGRQAVILETAQFIRSGASKDAAAVPDKHGRQPFHDPALATLDNFNTQHPSDVLSREKVEQLAFDVGLDKVLRWKPRMPENLSGSGIQVVLNGAVHAIIGAISLQHGAAVASKIVRERILSRV